MALQAVSTLFFGPPPSQCLANCDESNYQNLIVTKCNHVFCKACLLQQTKKDCPICRSITLADVSTFQLCIDKFTYYIHDDFSPLKTTATTENVKLKISTYATLKEEKAKKSSQTKDDQDNCSICLTAPIPSHLYFIIKDKEPSKVGSYIHEDCLQKTNIADDSTILEIEVNQFVKIANKLKPRPMSAIKIFFLAILLPMSIWAYATNKDRPEQSVILLVLSIPALVIFQIFSLVLYGLKTVIKDKSSINSNIDKQLPSYGEH